MIHSSDYILEETDMPDGLIRGVRGVQGNDIFSQTLPEVDLHSNDFYYNVIKLFIT